MHITKKQRVKTGKRHRNKSRLTKGHKNKTRLTKRHNKKNHRVRTYRHIRKNSDINGEKLVDDSVSVYNKETDSGNIINGMRDFLHKKRFIM